MEANKDGTVVREIRLPAAVLARTSNGTVYIVTDNDGVDNSTGETQFLNLGNVLN